MLVDSCFNFIFSFVSEACYTEVLSLVRCDEFHVIILVVDVGNWNTGVL